MKDHPLKSHVVGVKCRFKKHLKIGLSEMFWEQATHPCSTEGQTSSANATFNRPNQKRDIRYFEIANIRPFTHSRSERSPGRREINLYALLIRSSRKRTKSFSNFDRKSKRRRFSKTKGEDEQSNCNKHTFFYF